jgi:hypothetical protein
MPGRRQLRGMITCATYDYMCDLIVYDDANPDGLVWDSPFPVQVLNT